MPFLYPRSSVAGKSGSSSTTSVLELVVVFLVEEEVVEDAEAEVEEDDDDDKLLALVVVVVVAAVAGRLRGGSGFFTSGFLQMRLWNVQSLAWHVRAQYTAFLHTEHLSLAPGLWQLRHVSAAAGRHQGTRSAAVAFFVVVVVTANVFKARVVVRVHFDFACLVNETTRGIRSAATARVW